ALIDLPEPELAETDRLAKLKTLGGSLAKGRIELHDAGERALPKQPGADRLLLVVGQAGGRFTPGPDDLARHRQPFLERLRDAAEAGPLWVVLTLRGDFVRHVLARRRLSDRLQGSTVHLGPMVRDELERAVKEPAAQFGLGFEPGLVRRILDD